MQTLRTQYLVYEAGREKVIVGVPDLAITDCRHNCGMCAVLEGGADTLGSCNSCSEGEETRKFRSNGSIF